jgi:hypothetical protein
MAVFHKKDAGIVCETAGGGVSHRAGLRFRVTSLSFMAALMRVNPDAVARVNADPVVVPRLLHDDRHAQGSPDLHLLSD